MSGLWNGIDLAQIDAEYEARTGKAGWLPVTVPDRNHWLWGRALADGLDYRLGKLRVPHNQLDSDVEAYGVAVDAENDREWIRLIYEVRLREREGVIYTRCGCEQGLNRRPCAHVALVLMRTDRWPFAEREQVAD